MDNKHPGWYPDPITPDSLIRRWDGTKWTGDVRPGPAPTPSPAFLPPPASPAQGIVTCPDCRGKVSLQAPACVHCGRPTDAMAPEEASPPEPSPPLPPPPPGFTTQAELSPPNMTPGVTPTVAAAASPSSYRAPGGRGSGGPSALTRDVRAFVALLVGLIAASLSWLAYAGWGLTMAILAAVAVIATLFLASRAKRRALRVGARKSRMVLVARLLALASIALLAFAVFHLVRSYV